MWNGLAKATRRTGTAPLQAISNLQDVSFISGWQNSLSNTVLLLGLGLGVYRTNWTDHEYYLGLGKGTVQNATSDILGAKLLCNGKKPCEPTWQGVEAAVPPIRVSGHSGTDGDWVTTCAGLRTFTGKHAYTHARELHACGWAVHSAGSFGLITACMDQCTSSTPSSSPSMQHILSSACPPCLTATNFFYLNPSTPSMEHILPSVCSPCLTAMNF